MTIESQNKVAIVNILIESLPYIQRFHRKTFVIKYGGNAMVSEQLKNSFTRDIVLMKLVGMDPVIVHGGGPQIAELLSKAGKESEFINGMRVTDNETMDIVEKVLGDQINGEIVTLLRKNGGAAIGLTGKTQNLIVAKKMTLKSHKDFDIGHVGEIEHIDAAVISTLITDNFIPVIAPIGIGSDDQSYNINADLAAGKIAEALQAEKLIILTDTSGLMDAESKVLASVSTTDVSKLIERGIISGGMLPKIEAAMNAVNNGVNNAHIIDGRIPHATLLEIFTDQGIGTLINRHSIV